MTDQTLNETERGLLQGASQALGFVRRSEGICDCEFDPDPNDPDESTPETAWHYTRTCEHCGNIWCGLHCPHDGYQNPCPACNVRPTPL